VALRNQQKLRQQIRLARATVRAKKQFRSDVSMLVRERAIIRRYLIHGRDSQRYTTGSHTGAGAQANDHPETNNS
jgi:hypothetical protein